MIERHGIRRALVALVVCYSAFHLGYSMYRYNIFEGTASLDFRRVFDEAHLWKTTHTLDFNHVLYPPLYYALLAPFTALEFKTAALLFYFSQFLWYGAAVVLMVKTAWKDPKPPMAAYALAAVLTVNFQRFLETLALHKVEGIEFFLICAAIYAFKRQRDLRAGVVTLFAASLKYLPGILLLYFLVKRQYRVLLGALAALVLSLVVMLPLFGADVIRSYLAYPIAMLFEHRHEGTLPQASVEFQTLTGTVNRWFAGFEGLRHHLKALSYAPVPNPQLAFAIAGLFKLLLVGGYLALIRRRLLLREREAQWLRVLCELSLTLLLMFVIAPASRVHYAILVLPAFVTVGLLLYQDPALFPLREKALFALAYGLTAMAIPGGALNRLPPHPVWGAQHALAYLWLSFPFYGNLLLGVCLILCRGRFQRAHEPIRHP